MAIGSTLSGLNIRHVSIDSVDVGITQLDMHSSCEVVGSEDTSNLYRVFREFFNISIKNESENIEII